MLAERQVLGVIALCGWVALWWLAVRIACGRRFGTFEWVPVALLAFGVPILVADFTATTAWGLSGGQLMAAWAGVAAAIDMGWLACWLYRRHARCGAEQDAERGAAVDGGGR